MVAATETCLQPLTSSLLARCRGQPPPLLLYLPLMVVDDGVAAVYLRSAAVPIAPPPIFRLMPFRRRRRHVPSVGWRFFVLLGQYRTLFFFPSKNLAKETV